MSNRKPSQDIRELVVGAVKEGIDSKEPSLEVSPFWFRSFHYTTNPLELLVADNPLVEDFSNLFINRGAEIKVFSRYFGEAPKLPYNLHIAVVGSKGIGKHTTLKVITHIISESFPEISFEFYNLESQHNYKTNEPISSKKMEELDNLNLNVRIISCSGKNKWLFIKRIGDYKKSTNLTISIWNTRNYPTEDDLLVNKEIFFNNYSQEVIYQIFDRRIRSCSESNNKSQDYIQSVYKNLLPRLATSFQGNLHICFLLFREAHQKARVMDAKTLSVEFVDSVVKDYLEIKNQKITSKEQEIINYYLGRENKIYITTSNLAEDLEINRTVAWKYLEKLTEKRVFRKIKYGNPSKYQINDIFLSFYEDELRKTIIFKQK